MRTATMKCGPENCPLTAWAALSPSERKVQRKSLAETLYKQGFTMEEIATQFGVTHKTISLDLEDICTEGTNVKERGKDTRGRKKSTGRPKGSGRSKTRPPEHYAAAAKALDEGKTRVEVAAETGLSEHQVQLSRERELGRREMLTSLLDAAAAKNFTDKGKLRIEDAIRIHTHRLNRIFEQQVNEEVRKRIAAANDAARAHNKDLIAENFALARIVNERGVFTSTQFNQMLKLCHPDSSASEETKATLVNILVQNKKRLIKETVR